MPHRCRNLRLCVLLAFAAAAIGGPLPAQERADLVIAQRAEKLVRATHAGGESVWRLVPATSAASGEQVWYTVSFTNAGLEPIAHASVTARIPAGMRYVADSASGPGTDIRFSIDGGAVFAAPNQLTFGAGAEQRPAAAGFYTDIRWVMRHPLAPGATAHARFRATPAVPASPDAGNPAEGAGVAEGAGHLVR